MNQENPDKKLNKKLIIKELKELYKTSKDIIIVSLILIIFILLYALNQNNTINPSEKVFDKIQTSTTTKDTIEMNNKAAITTTYRGDSRIQDDYIIDTDAVKVLIAPLHEKATLNPQFLCKDILTESESHNNIYYYVLAEYDRLNNKYGAYKKTINYIGEDLNNINAELQFVKNECALRGYHIK